MKWYSIANRVVVTVLMLSITTVVATQVFFRFVLDAPLSWPEELGRLIFIWLVFLGSIVVTHNNDHISIELFDQMLEGKPGLKRAVAILRHTIFLIVMVVVVIGGLEIVPRTHRLSLSATRLPRSLLTLSVVVGGAFMALESIRQIYRAAVGADDRAIGPDTEGST